MGMDPVAIAALILSIISILLWIFTFLFPNSLKALFGNLLQSNSPNKEEQRTTEKRAYPAHAKDSENHTNEKDTASAESQFMNETQKFSQMVQKNLEMLNTRVGVKFSVRAISGEYTDKKRKEPGYVESVDVTENKDKGMLTDESGGNP